MIIVLQSLDSMHSTGFGHEDIQHWPAGVLEALLTAGILRESDYARSVICRECGDSCSVEVEIIDSGDGLPPRAFHDCPYRDDIGRVHVPLDELRTFCVSPNGLLRWLAQELLVENSTQELVVDRFWWLGQPGIPGVPSFDVFFVRGAAWSDAGAVFQNVGRLRECIHAIVLTPSAVPIPSPFEPNIKVNSLTRLLSFTKDALLFNRDEMARIIGRERTKRTQAVIPIHTPPGTTWELVSIEFANDETIRISIGNLVKHKHYSELGFIDRRKTAELPDRLWLAFRYLAEHDGRATWQQKTNIASPNATLKKNIQELRQRLQTIFPDIPSDPFKSYRTEKAYETRFTLTMVGRSSGIR